MKNCRRLLIALVIFAMMLPLSITAMPVFASEVSPAAESTSTDYGTVPTENAGNTFVLFDGDKNFLSGADTWAAASAAARVWLDANPGKTVNILLQKDHTVTATAGNDDWLGHMNGTVNIDLGGHTMIADAHIYVGINTTYTGNFATTITVQNGTMLNGKGLLFSAYNKPGVAKQISYSFKNCTFGYNTATVAKGNDILFFLWKTANDDAGVMDVDMEFDNCTFDSTGYPLDVYTDKTPAFFYHQTDADIQVDVEIKGGELIISDVAKIRNFIPASGDSVTFLPDADGNYATSVVPSGSVPTKNAVTDAYGTLSFTKLIKIGKDQNVYALPIPAAEDIETAYGTIPAEKLDGAAVFAVFQSGEFLGGYPTWQTVTNAVKAALDADSANTVQVLLLSSIQSTTGMANGKNLSYMAGEVIYDLNGHTIIADGRLFDSTLTASTTPASGATTVKVKNGTLLQGKNYIFYGENKLLGTKTVDFYFDDVTFGFYGPTSLNNAEIMFRAQGAESTGLLTLNATFNGCTVDVSSYPSSGTDVNGNAFTGKTPIIFYNQKAHDKSNVKMFIKVYGGEFIVGNLNKIEIIRSTAKPGVMFYPTNTGKWPTVSVVDGNTPTWTIPTEDGDVGFTKLVTDGADRDVYTLPVLTGRPIETEYGTIPAEHETAVFVVFQDGKFLTGTGSWNTANQTAREALAADPTKAVTVLLRQNAEADSINVANRLCWMNGTVVYDLGGYTLSAAKTILEAGISTTYDGSCDPNIIIKNGTLLAAATHILATENKTSYAEEMTISFENVTLGNASSVASNRGYLFQNWGGSGALDLKLNFTNCALDTTGWNEAYPTSNYSLFRTNGKVVQNVTITGGQIVTDAPNLLTLDVGGSTLLFKKDANGEYTTMSVANGKIPTQSANTDTVYSSFTKLVTDGAERDIYALEEVVLSTKYGNIPASAADCVFAIFQNGSFVAGVDAWKDVNTKVLAALANDSSKPVQVLLRGNYTVTATFNNSEWCGHLDGEVIYDLDGYTMIADANIFSAGINTDYSGDFATTVTVKNGTLLNGKGLIFSAHNKPGVAKTIDFTFENCTFGFNPGTVNISRDIFFFCWKTDSNGSGVLDLNVTLDGCTFDARDWPDSFDKKATFIHHQSDTDIAPSFTIKGGEIITNSLKYLQVYLLPNTVDKIVFAADSEGNYTTLSVLNGEKPSVWLPTDVGEGDFSKLVSDGTDRDVYALQLYEQIDTEYLLYVEYNGERLYKAPFYIPAGAEFNAVYLDAAKYEGMLITESTNSIRLSGSAGLRFATRIDAELLDELYALLAEGALDSVEFGTLIAPIDYVADELTIAKLQAAGKAYLRVTANYNEYFNYDTDDSTTHFVGSIVNLYEHNVDRTFLGRGYVKIVPKTGDAIILYSAHTQAADVQSVANTILEEKPDYVATLTADQKAVLDQFAAGAVPPVDEETEADRKLHGLNVLAIGDSLFYGDALERHEQWIAVLARECNWNLTNLGKGGWTLGHKDGRNNYSMSYHLLNDANYVYGSTSYYNMGNTAGKTADDVDLIFLEGGFNDWGQKVPYGTPTSTDVYTMLGGMNVIIQTLRETYKNATIVLITSWHIDGTQTIDNETVYRLNYTAEGMKAVYEANYKDDPQIKLIDAGDPALTDIHMYDPDWREIYSIKPTDFCHLNAKGMAIMAEHMLPLLKETLLTPKETQPEEEDDSVTLPTAPFASAEDCIAANTGNSYVLTGDTAPYYMGRWFEKEYDGVKHMVTLNAGSVVYFMVNGAETVNVDFTVTTVNDVDTPYFSYSIDGSTPVRQLVTNGEVALPDTGYHIVRIITDSVTEGVGKWDNEIGFALKSIAVSEGGEMIGVKPVDKTIFFYGDSITEGVNAITRGGKSANNSVTAAYSWLTAEKLNAVPYIVGYGGSGMVKTGSFNTMENAVQYYSNNRPVNDGILPDVIVINHGHNDSSFSDAEFEAALLRTIALLRELYPDVEIVYMIPFNQAKSVSIKSVLYSLYDEKIHIVETSNWVITKTDGAHPDAAGAEVAATNLSEKLIEIFGKEFFGL